SAGTYTDTSADDTFNNLTGSLALAASDADSGTTLTYGIQGVTPVGVLATKVGAYGTLTVNTATGAYTYTPVDTLIENRKAGDTDDFAITVTDGVIATPVVNTLT